MRLFTKNWTQRHKMVYDYFCSIADSKGVKPTNEGFCRLLRISRGKLQKWTLGQWPSAEDLETIHDEFGFSYRWLITGEDDPFEEACPRCEALSGKGPRGNLIESDVSDLANEVKSLKLELADKILESARLKEHVASIKSDISKSIQVHGAHICADAALIREMQHAVHNYESVLEEAHPHQAAAGE